MAGAMHEASGARPATRRDWQSRVLVREMWASLAIAVMWLAVLFDAIFGPDLHFQSATPGGTASTTAIPTVIIVALFAWLATRAVARYGFTRPEDRG